MSIGDRIRELRESIGISQVQLADRIGVSKQSMYKYEKGIVTNIPSDKIELIAKITGTTPKYIMGWDDVEEQPLSSWVRIPVLGRVAAGSPIDAIEDRIGEEEIPRSMALKGEYFGLVIKGDSMEPDMRDGDIAIVRKQDDAESGEIVIAIVDDEDAVCKKLIKTDSGVMLVSLNHRYDPMVFAHVQIVGKVVELRRKF